MAVQPANGAGKGVLSQSKRRKKPVHWLAWTALSICLCLVVGRALWKPPEADSALEHAGSCPIEFPGGIEPVLRVNGRLYQWGGLNSSGMIVADENDVVYGHTYLPEGFEAAGEIASVATDLPAQDFQLQAGVPFSGTVYTNPEAPLVVYACVSTDWIRDCYARFVNEDYKTGAIRVAGKLYRWYDDSWGCYGRLEELPQGAVCMGEIQNVVEDRYPVNDLEANNDDFYLHMTGREIFQDPADDSVIYVQAEQHWSGGIDSYWRVCPRWEYDAD